MKTIKVKESIAWWVSQMDEMQIADIEREYQDEMEGIGDE